MIIFQFMVGFIIVGAITWLGYTNRRELPAPGKPDDAGERLAFAIQCLYPMILVVLVNFIAVVLCRADPKVYNPLAGHDQGHKIQSYKNILTNSVEQFLISSVLMLVYASMTTCAEGLKIIPVYSFLFVLARILFVFGYSKSPKYRSFGMSINIIITTALAMFIGYNYYRNFSSIVEVIRTEL